MPAALRRCWWTQVGGAGEGTAAGKLPCMPRSTPATAGAPWPWLFVVGRLVCASWKRQRPTCAAPPSAAGRVVNRTYGRRVALHEAGHFLVGPPARLGAPEMGSSAHHCPCAQRRSRSACIPTAQVAYLLGLLPRGYTLSSLDLFIRWATLPCAAAAAIVAAASAGNCGLHMRWQASRRTQRADEAGNEKQAWDSKARHVYNRLNPHSLSICAQ